MHLVRLLRAFVGLTLTVLIQPDQLQRHVTRLNLRQQRILHLLRFSVAIYQNLVRQLFEPVTYLRDKKDHKYDCTAKKLGIF